MKTASLCVVAVLVLMQGIRAGGEDAQPKPDAAKKQLVVRLKVFEGDPNGSRQDGTIRCLAEPTMAAMEGRPFSWFSGNEIPLLDPPNGKEEYVMTGMEFTGRVDRIKDGRVRVDLALSQTKASETTKQREQLQTTTTRTITTLKLGEVTKLPWRKADGDKQTWAELSVEE